MTSRFSLMLGAAGFALAGCSSPASDGPPAPPSTNPQFASGGATSGSGGQSTLPVGGSGGSSTSGTAGRGGAPQASGGSGGAPGGGAGGGGAIPTGTGLALTPDVMGWIAGTTNEVGIQGGFHTISDANPVPPAPPGVTTITLDPFSEATGFSACVSGTASAVPAAVPPSTDRPYSQFWGGGLGLNLSDPGGGMPAQPWNRGNVIGFRYTLSGPMIPAGIGLRFQVKFVGETGAGYCAPAGTAGAPVTMNISGETSTITQACYDPLPGAKIPATAPLLSLQWQVAAGDTPTPFDFCVDDLTAIVAP